MRVEGNLDVKTAAQFRLTSSALWQLPSCAYVPIMKSYILAEVPDDPSDVYLALKAAWLAPRTCIGRPSSGTSSSLLVSPNLPLPLADFSIARLTMSRLRLLKLNLLVVHLALLGALFVPLVFGQEHSALSNPAARACSELQRQLGATIIQTSSGAEYRNISSGAWNRHNALSQPACVALPTSTADVQAVQKSIFRYGVRYAVQAGGHSAGAGWSSVDGGILISFSRMKSISYDATRDLVTLQPGIRWGEAVDALEPFGVAVMGGRLSDVGTGLLLGGGLSYLSAGHGFSVDALVEADVVLVNGDLVTATRTNRYSDLLKALKGGANRFGIVTRYVLKPVHVGRRADKAFYGGTIFYDNSTSEALLKATANFINNVNDPKASLLSVLSISLANNTIFPINFVTFFYHGTTPPPALYAEFLALPNLGSSVGLYSYVEAVNLVGTGREGGGQGQMFGASAFGSLDYERQLGRAGSGLDPYARYSKAYSDFVKYGEKVVGNPSAAGAGSGGVDDPAKDGVEFSLLAFTPVQKSQVLVGRANGGNVIDAPLANYHLVQFHTQMPPGLDEVSTRVRNARRELLNKLTPSPGLPLYVNECDRSQNVLATYGGYNFLRRTYSKYDPSRFNVRYTDGPLGL